MQDSQEGQARVGIAIDDRKLKASIEQVFVRRCMATSAALDQGHMLAIGEVASFVAQKTRELAGSIADSANKLAAEQAEEAHNRVRQHAAIIVMLMHEFGQSELTLDATREFAVGLELEHDEEQRMVHLKMTEVQQAQGAH